MPAMTAWLGRNGLSAKPARFKFIYASLAATINQLNKMIFNLDRRALTRYAHSLLESPVVEFAPLRSRGKLTGEIVLGVDGC